MSNWELRQTFYRDGKWYAVYRGEVVVSHCQLHDGEAPKHTPMAGLMAVANKRLLDELDAVLAERSASRVLRARAIIARERGNAT